MTCPPGLQPSHATFMADYESYIATAASATNLPMSAIASQWFDEWGMPYNNPGNVTASKGFCTSGSCGGLPAFCTLEDGVQAYIANVNSLYQGGSGAELTIYNKPSHWTFNWQWGFEGGQIATKITTAANTNGQSCSHTSTSQAFYGVNDTPSGSSRQQIQAYREQAAQAVMEAMGASRWAGGHYWSCNDTYAGETLIHIAMDSGWLYSYS